MTPTAPSTGSSPDDHRERAPEAAWSDGPQHGSTPVLAPSMASVRVALALGVLLTLLLLCSLYALIALWPAIEAATSDPATETTVTLFGFDWTPNKEVALLLMVTFASALGGSLHAAISFTDYVGNRRLTTSWIWWYVLRVLLGTSLAVLFYFAIRGGLFSANTSTDDINPFGIAALAGLVGLFSKQATDKLRELFDTMFRTAPGQGDDQRADGIVNPRPVLTGIEPLMVDVGAAALDVRIRGEGFTARSVVHVTRPSDPPGKMSRRKTVFVSATELRVRLVARDLVDQGTVRLLVRNPPPGGGESTAAQLEVRVPVVEPAVTNGGQE